MAFTILSMFRKRRRYHNALQFMSICECVPTIGCTSFHLDKYTKKDIWKFAIDFLTLFLLFFYVVCYPLLLTLSTHFFSFFFFWFKKKNVCLLLRFVWSELESIREELSRQIQNNRHYKTYAKSFRFWRKIYQTNEMCMFEFKLLKLKSIAPP